MSIIDAIKDMEKHMGTTDFNIMEDDFTGKRVGRLIILPHWNTDEHGKKKYLCKCDCGNKGSDKSAIEQYRTKK